MGFHKDTVDQFLNGKPVVETLKGVGDTDVNSYNTFKAAFKCPDIAPLRPGPCPEWSNNLSIQQSIMTDISIKTGKIIDDLCIEYIEKYLGRKFDMATDMERLNRVTYPDTPPGDFYLWMDGKALGYLTVKWEFGHTPEQSKVHADVRFIPAKPSK